MTDVYCHNRHNKLSWAEPHSSFPLNLQTKLSFKIFQCMSENIWAQQIWIWKNVVSEKILGLKKCLVWKSFWSEKFWSQKCWVQKLVVSENLLFPIKCCVRKNIGSEKKLIPKVFWVWQIFWSNKFWVWKIFGPKKFGF